LTVGKIEGISPSDVEPDEPDDDAIPGDEDAAPPDDDGDTELDDDGEPGPSSEGEPSDQTDESSPDATSDEGEKSPGEPKDDLPEGFASRDELVAAAKASRQYQQEAERTRDLLLEQLRQRQAPPEPPRPKAAWIAGADDPEVVRAWRQTGGNAEAIKSLPADLASRVSSFDRALSDRWGTYQADPSALVRDHVIPMLEGSRLVQEVLAMKNELAVLKGREFLGKHASVIQTTADREALANLLDRGVDRETAIRVVAAEKKAAAMEAAAKKNGKSAAAEAEKAKARASQANKRGGQRPGRPGQAPRTTNVKDLFERALKVHENK